MDKELIAMCDTPEIQERFVGLSDYEIEHSFKLGTVHKEMANWSKRIVCPSVSWFLREIEVGEENWLELHKDAEDKFVAEYDSILNMTDTPKFVSPIVDSPEKVLLHVLLWQKGKVWKDKWVRKEG